MDKLVSQKIKASKSTPSPRMGISLSYYQGSLYMFGYSPLKEVPNSILYRFDLDTYEWDIVKTLGNPPNPRTQHYATVYNEEMYIIYGLLFENIFEYDSIFKFNFASKTWIFLSNEPRSRVSLAASVLVGSKFYLFYGGTTVEMLNSVVSLDLSFTPPKREVVSSDYASPDARIYHCSVVISNYMYTFGGGYFNTDTTETLYNDLWQFNFITSKWSFMNTFGDAPSARKSFGCTKSIGDVFAIFGGSGKDGFLGDFYYYHETFKTWYQIQPEGLSPSPRSGSCLTYHNYRYFIIGGKNKEKGFNEIWKYSAESNKFELMNEQIFKNGNDIHYAQCWVEEQDENVEIVIVGGCNFFNIPNFYTIRINIFEKNNTVMVNQSYLNQSDIMPFVVAAGSTFVKSGDSLFIVGGLAYNLVMISPVRVKNLKTGQFFNYNTSDTLNLYGATGVHFQKSFYIFGGGGNKDTIRSSFKITNTLHKLNFNTSDYFSLLCSEGHNEETCDPCPPGSFSKKGSCISCPKGRFSKTISSTSLEQCQPCPFGTFNDKEGSFNCLDCPSGQSCPIGSSSPKSSVVFPSNSSSQPGAFENKKRFISLIVQNLWFSGLGLAAFVIFLSFSFVALWDKIQDFDFFVAQHSNQLGVPVVHRKTKTGGVFSLFFILASIITGVAAVLSFGMDNVSEIKTLVPLMILDEKVEAREMIVTSVFYIYGGNCSDFNGNCNSDIFFQDSGLAYSSKSVSCFFIQENCEIQAKYLNLEVTSKTSKIQIKLKEKSSYSTAISVNISTSSSIPGEFSSIFVSFTTGSEDTLFRGTVPSNVYFKMTPSVKFIQLFTSESSEWPSKETGFHVSSPQEPERGTLSNREMINIQIHLLLDIVILESETAMKTIRTLNQSAFVFLGALLGSIFGLLGTFSTVMGYVESLVEKVENRRKKNLDALGIKEKFRNLKGEFGKWFMFNKSRKVIPSNVFQYSVAITCQQE